MSVTKVERRQLSLADSRNLVDQFAAEVQDHIDRGHDTLQSVVRFMEHPFVQISAALHAVSPAHFSDAARLIELIGETVKAAMQARAQLNDPKRVDDAKRAVSRAVESTFAFGNAVQDFALAGTVASAEYAALTFEQHEARYSQAVDLVSGLVRTSEIAALEKDLNYASILTDDAKATQTDLINRVRSSVAGLRPL